MINWELPHEKPACPHCGSTETQLTLQLLGLIRYSCNNCRKSFATKDDSKKASRSQTEAPTLRRA
jgi:transposase-like protein